MADEWIVDVLTDLRSFAQANNMVHLAASLAQTLAVARAELGSGPFVGNARHAGDDAGAGPSAPSAPSAPSN